jgi:hypothetical protein
MLEIEKVRRARRRLRLCVAARRSPTAARSTGVAPAVRFVLDGLDRPLSLVKTSHTGQTKSVVVVLQKEPRSFKYHIDALPHI